jgi:DNA primase
VPAPHDPDSFIKANGGTAFQTLIEQAAGFFDYYLQRICATNDAATDKGRQAILRGMAEAVHKTGSAVLVDKYAQKTALRLGVSADAVRAEFRKAPRPRMPGSEAPEESLAEEVQPQRPSPQEYWLLKLLFLRDESAAWMAANLDPGWIQHALVRQIILLRLEAERNHSWQNLGTFLDQCESPQMQSLITEAASEQRAIPNPAQQLADVALRLRNQFIDRQLQDLTRRANLPECPDAERIVLLREQQELRELKRQLIPPPPE